MLVPQSVSQSIEVFKISTQFRNWPQKVEELGEEGNHLPQDPNQNDIRMCVQLYEAVKASLSTLLKIQHSCTSSPTRPTRRSRHRLVRPIALTYTTIRGMTLVFKVLLCRH